MEKFRTLSLGDTHGRDIWKIALFGGRKEYEQWREICDEGPVDIRDYPLSKYDKVVFIGDYVDSWLIPLSTIKMNLSDIVHLKLHFPEIIVLILGNHDTSYINNLFCSGFQGSMQHDYNELFSTKLERDSIFQMAYQHKDWLWTHAGITMGFYNTVIVPLMNDKKSRFSTFYKNCTNLAEIINFMYESGEESIFNIGWSRGGYSRAPGPLWADKTDLTGKPALGVNQIVGHTPQDYINWRIFEGGRHEKHPIKVYFIDDLEYGANQILDIDFTDEIPIISIITLNENL